MNSKPLKFKIKEAIVAQNKIAIWWLGQAGFIIKTDRNILICVDLYLSNAVERICGFKRLLPSPIKPEEIEADFIICTHEHPDHLDPDAIPLIARHSKARFIGPKSCVQEFKKVGIKQERIIELAEEKTVEMESISITGVYADHGKLSLDTLGILFNFGKVKIYYCGDTAYRPKKIQYIKSEKPDIIILPINGRYGNLNEKEAIFLSKYIGARLTIPSHYGMFTEHNGDLDYFVEIAKKEGIEFKVLSIGETFIYPQ